MHEFEIGYAPLKLADTKLYVRMTPEGRPQLVRIEPHYNDAGILIPISVWMYVDDEPGIIMDRLVAEMMTEAYTPIESITRWRQPN